MNQYDTEMTQYGADDKQRWHDKAQSDGGHDSVDTHVDPHFRPGNKGHFTNPSVDSVMTIAPTPPPPRHTFPEGGCKAYLTVLGATFALFSGFGQMNAFGTFQTYYQEHQLAHLEPSVISWIGSVQLWVFFFSGGFIGMAFDAYGPRILMVAGAMCYILSIMLTSISTQYWHYILSQGVLFGLGVGLLFYPSLSSVSTYFFKYRATALGVAAAGSSAGGFMYPLMLQTLFKRVGFGWTVRISGLVSAVGCGIALLTVTALTPRPGPKGQHSFSILSTFKDRRYLLLVIGSCLVALGLFIPLFYIDSYTRSLELPQAKLVLALMNLGGVAGRVLPAMLSDKVGRFNILIPSALLSGVFTLAFWIPARSIALIIVYSLLYGGSSGAFISVITPCVAQISELREIGRRIGLLYTIISFPALVCGPTGGALLTHDHGYTGMIIFSGVTVIAGSCVIMGSKLAIDSRILAKV